MPKQKLNHCIPEENDETQNIKVDNEILSLEAVGTYWRSAW